MAFLSGAIDKEAISFVAARCAKLGGDCRVGIEALLKAGRVAEKENSKQVLLSHAKNAFDSVQGASVLKGVKYLTKPEIVLLSILSDEGELSSGKIFDLFLEKSSEELSARRLRDVLNGLEKKGFVSSKPVNLGNQGKTRLFNCVLPKNLLSKELQKTNP